MAGKPNTSGGGCISRIFYLIVIVYIIKYKYVILLLVAVGGMAVLVSRGMKKHEQGNVAKIAESNIGAMCGRKSDNQSEHISGITTEQRLEPNIQEISNCLTSIQKDNWGIEETILQKARGIDLCPSTTAHSIENNGKKNQTDDTYKHTVDNVKKINNKDKVDDLEKFMIECSAYVEREAAIRRILQY